MAVIRPEKAAKVAEIKELLTASKCTIVVDFCAMTVARRFRACIGEKHCNCSCS